MLSASSTDVLASGTGVAALAAGAFGETVIDNVNVTVNMVSNAANLEMIYAGLVAFTKDKVVIKNSTVAGSIDVTLASGTVSTVAGVVGLYNASEISNVTSDVDINVNASAKVDVGGVVANA